MPTALRSLMLALAMNLTLAAAEPPSLFSAADTASRRLQAGAIVVAESRSGQVQYHLAGQGIAGLAPEEHRFEIGSITKVFTGLLLAQAVVEGKVTLATTLRDLLGADFTFADPHVAAITLEQLSTHTSGLPRLPSNLGPNPDASTDPYAAYDRAALHAFLRTARLAGPAPHPAAYSNLGVGLLGDLLSQLYDQPWETLIVERIARPLQLTGVRMTPKPDDAARLAPPFQGDQPDHPWHFQAMAGAGALHATAADLIRFGQALLNPDATPLAAALRLTREARADFSERGSRIGLGIIHQQFLGEPTLEHDGGTGGYRSSLQIQPRSGIVRVVLSNNAAFAPQSLFAALDPARTAPPPREIPIPPERLQDYPGIYVSGPQARFTVLSRGKDLWIRLSGQPFFRLFGQGKDRFFLKVAPARIEFTRDAAGRVTALTLFQNGREQPAQRDDTPLPKLLFRPAAELERYPGTYMLAPQALFTVTLRAGTLFVQLTGQPALPVFETRQGYFEYDVVEAAIEFEQNDQGAVTGLILHQNGTHRAPRLASPAPPVKP